jgi:hypothetical protein
MGYAGQLLVADELPALVSAAGAASNTITATSWTVLPGGSLTASITNPSATRDLVCDLSYAAKVSASASDVRVSVALTGGLTVGAGAVEPSWAYRLWYAGASLVTLQTHFPITIPAGATAVTATMYAYRASATGTQQCDYPVILWTPLYYSMP